MNEIIGDDVAIVGFELEGQSALRYLKSKFPNKKITLRDKKTKDIIQDQSINVIWGEDYLSELSQHSTIIRTPGLPYNCEPLTKFKNNGGHITTATNIFFSESIGTIVGITGTKGKSTTTALVYHILQNNNSHVYLGGNIGVPMLDLLEKNHKEAIFVLELSSYQLEDLRYSPNISVLLEIVPEHLDHHGSLENYIKAKQHITSSQTNLDYLITNPSYKNISNIVSSSSATIIKFNNSHEKDITTYIQNNAYYNNESFIIPTIDVPLIGKGNQENTMAAITVASLFGIKPNQMANAIKSFQPLPHRLEIIATKNEITFVNDSIATTPEAAINALEAFEGKVDTLIAGGFDRGLNYENLAQYIVDHPITNLILFPDTGTKIELSVKMRDHDKKINIFPVSTMNNAVDLAFKITKENKICLLSPASASYNMYKNFMERGQAFKQAIAEHN